MPTRKNKPKVKYSKKVIDFILDKMETEGLLPGAVCNKYPDECPDRKAFYRWQREHPELEEQMNQAYTLWSMQQVEELYLYSRPEWCTEHLHEFKGDIRLAMEARRSKLDTLKFAVGKILPILNKRWSEIKTIDVKGEGIKPQFVIMNYSDSIQNGDNDSTYDSTSEHSVTQ
jgi:hypothetical protein